MATRVKTSAAKASHSVRTTDETWGRAKRRAEADGVNMNHVISEFLDGYGRGFIDLPKVTKTYTPPQSAAPAPAP